MEKERAAKESCTSSLNNNNNNNNGRGDNKNMSSTTTTNENIKINSNSSSIKQSPSVVAVVEQEHTNDDCGDDENPIFHPAIDFVSDDSTS